MNRRAKGTLVRAALVVTSGFLLVLVLAPALGAASTPASVLNPGERGSRSFGDDLVDPPMFGLGPVGQAQGAILLDGIDEEALEPAGTLVVVGPQEGLSSSEAAALRSFVARGGRLVVLDDGPQGNAYLTAAGADTRIRASPLRDLVYEKQPAFPVVTDLDPTHPVTRNVDRVVLNHASALTPGSRATTLAETSPSSWIDADADDRPDEQEEKGPFPVVVEEPVGSGSVLVASDASLVSDAMRGAAGNQQLAADLAAYARAPAGPVRVDEAHRAALDPVGLLPVPGATLAALSLALLGLVAVEPGAAAHRLRRVRRAVSGIVDPGDDETPATLVEAALDRNPDWDEARLHDIVASWEGRDGGG